VFTAGMDRPLALFLLALCSSCVPCPEVECTDIVDIVFSERMVSTTYDVAIEADGTDLEFTCPFALGSAPDEVKDRVRSCDAFGVQITGSMTRVAVSVTGNFLHGEETLGVEYQPSHFASAPTCATGCRRAELLLTLVPVD
jgi:hypothetical protein